MKNNDKTLVENAYDVIKDQIISFSLQPEAPVSDSNIAKTLKISRAPVREAIIRLQMEGLITTNHQGKLVVAPINLNEVTDILAVRRALETEAIQIIASHGWLTSRQENELQKIEELHKKSLYSVLAADIYQYDDLLHSTIIQYSKSPRIQHILNNMRLQMQRARWLNITFPDRQSEAIAEHQKILSRIVKHDLNGSIAAIEEHFLNSQKGFARILYDDDIRATASAIRNFYSSNLANILE